MHLYDLIGGKCKIRKRGDSPASSYSSAPLSYRFKRGVLIRRRSAATPSSARGRTTSQSSASILRIPRSPNPSTHSGGGGGRRKQETPVSVSARKLGATLWEMNSPPRLSTDHELKYSKEGRSTERIKSDYLSQRSEDRSYNFLSERNVGSGNSSQYRRNLVMAHNAPLALDKTRGYDSLSNASYNQIETRSWRLTPTGSISEVNPHLRDLRTGVATSRELLKVLSRMWGSEENYLSGKSILAALCAEFERASEQVNHLIQENYSCQKEINYLMKKFAEEKAVWKKNVHERVEASFNSISNDLEMERKLRKRSESLTKTLGRELTEAKAALSEVVFQLENEKRVREIMEGVGDLLARELAMGDSALVKQLRKEAAEDREELEKEREMLRLADVLREERVQMKLAEAKYHFEEKNAAVDKLRSDLEAFLRSKEVKETQSEPQNPAGKVEVGDDLITTMATVQSGEMGEGKSEQEHGEGCKDLDHKDDSSECDLHSIELNVDSNNRNCMWNWVAGIAQDDQKRPSVEKERSSVDKGVKGRKSTSEKVARGRSSFERCIPNGIDRDLNVKSTNQAHGKHSEIDCVTGTAQDDQKRPSVDQKRPSVDQERPSVDKDIKGRKSTSEKVARGRHSFERCIPNGIDQDMNAKGTNQAHGKRSEVDQLRSRSIKDLRNYITSSMRLTSAHRCSSPTKLWGS